MDLYLDTNAASYLFRRERWSPALLGEIRAALARECHAGRINLIVSTSLLDELSGIAHSDMRFYRRIVEFVLDLAGPRVLLPGDRRIKPEVSNHGPLTGPARFFSRGLRRAVRAEVRHRDFVRKVADEVRQRVIAFKADMEARRQEVRNKLGDDFSTKTAQWWDQALPQIDDWTRDYMRASRDALSLPANEADWPDPRTIPSAWLLNAYYMARITLNVGQNRRIDASDRYDSEHYANAQYTDLMVSDDKRFSDTYNIIPVQPFALESLKEFATGRLGVRVQ